jgi:hypothetical protein
MIYDPDVYSGSVCHPDMGFHKHGLFGPEPWAGVVLTVPLNLDERDRLSPEVGESEGET